MQTTHPYLRLCLSVRQTERGPDAPLPAPLVRRILGKALVDGFCSFGGPVCQPPAQAPGRAPAPRTLCSQAEMCPYGVLFAASLSPRPPFALHVPGGASTVELTLFGPAWRLYGWTVSALARALARGVGKRRTRWAVEAVTRRRPDGETERLCGADLARLPPALEPDRLSLAVAPRVTGQTVTAWPVTVELASPTRLIDDGRLVRDPRPVTLGLLVARILDRFAGIFGETSSEILRPESRAAIEAEAARVPIVSEATRWIEVKDYSARSRCELLMGGKVGRVVYGPEAARFLPILEIGEVLHVGKNPTAGCGRIAVSTGLPTLTRHAKPERPRRGFR